MRNVKKWTMVILVMTVRHQRNGGPKCYHCHKLGHIKRECPELTDMKSDRRKKKVTKPTHKVHRAEARKNSYSSDESVGLVVRHDHALSTAAGDVNSWIVDSWATCHMCNDRGLFIQLCNLKDPLSVTLGDGYCLEAQGRGDVKLKMKLSNGKTQNCTLHDVLYDSRTTCLVYIRQLRLEKQLCSMTQVMRYWILMELWWPLQHE